MSTSAPAPKNPPAAGITPAAETADSSSAAPSVTGASARDQPRRGGATTSLAPVRSARGVMRLSERTVSAIDNIPATPAETAPITSASGSTCRFNHLGPNAATHQPPTEHEDGKPGVEKTLRLELKLLADVGLVGFPNAGKSTLISRISAARPKIADYPFTTLEPNLGVVSPDADGYRTFVVADIPGLIEGAAEGHGLGIQFLRHVERTRLLAHLVDVSEFSGRKPVDDFNIVMKELKKFSDELASKPMMLIATKIDAAQDPKRISSLRQLAKRRGLPFFKISSVTGEGIAELKHAMAEQIIPPPEE
jgi:Obg family GTPase CgtA